VQLVLQLSLILGSQLSRNERGAHLSSQYIHPASLPHPWEGKDEASASPCAAQGEESPSAPCTNTCKEKGIYTPNDNPPCPA